MTSSTENNAQLRDTDTLMLNAGHMRRHLDSLRKTNPTLAGSIEAVWKSDAKSAQSIMTRGIAARLILSGMYDNYARRITEAEAEKAIAKMLTGALAVPESVKKAFEGVF